MIDNLPAPARLAAERAARLSLAAQSLGLDATPLVPSLVALAPELERCFSVRVDGDLASIALVTRGDPAGGDLADRLCDLLSSLHLSHDIARARDLLQGEGGPASIALCLDNDGGVKLSLERQSPPGGISLATALQKLWRGGGVGLPTSAASLLLDLGASLKTRADGVADEERPFGRVGRAAFVLRAERHLGDERAHVSEVLRTLGVTAPQQEYFADTYGALAIPGGHFAARLAVTREGIAREVAIEYRAVPLENMVRVWSSVHDLPALGARLGSLTGALDIARAAAFEIGYRTREPPGLSVTFDLGDASTLAMTAP